jgi:hypothetical protein
VSALILAAGKSAGEKCVLFGAEKSQITTFTGATAKFNPNLWRPIQ